MPVGTIFCLACARKNMSSSVRVREQLDLFLRPVPGDDVFLGTQSTDNPLVFRRLVTTNGKS